jgi:ribosomal protein S14
MKKKVRKDKKIRQRVFLHEIEKFILLHSSNNEFLTKSIRSNFHKDISSIPRDASYNRCVSRCIITGKRKRVNKWFSFSRLVLARLHRSKLILQWKKSKW